MAAATLGAHRIALGQTHGLPQGSPVPSPTELLEQATRAELALDFEQSIALYTEVIEKYPSSAASHSAQARLRDLHAHAEGAFDPLRALEAIRRDPSRSRSARDIDALVERAEHFPPGNVRLETWQFAADAYARRLGAPDKAEALLVRILGDGFSSSPRAPTRADASEAADTSAFACDSARELIALRLARGDIDGAESALDFFSAGTRINATALRELAGPVRKARACRYVHSASLSCLGLFIASSLVALGFVAWRNFKMRRSERVGASLGSADRDARGLTVSERRRVLNGLRLTPRAELAGLVGFAAFVGMTGAALAWAYTREARSGGPFLRFGVFLSLVLVLSRAWSAAGRQSLAARVGRGAVAACAAVSAAVVALEQSGLCVLDLTRP